VRLESKKKVTVNGKVFGGSKPLICLPLVARDETTLLQQAKAILPLTPDLLEWRIDRFDSVENIDTCMQALNALKKRMGTIPLIFTCRVDREGGCKKISPQKRLALLNAAIGSGEAEIVDVELCNGPEFIEAVKTACQKGGTKLILSHHNFAATPDEKAIHDQLLLAQDMGADIAKIAVMPNDYDDVLTLMSATLKARTGVVKIPIIAMSMGAEGGVTRVAGGLFGSDLTFAIGEASSAPGQIPIAELRQAMAVLYK